MFVSKSTRYLAVIAFFSPFLACSSEEPEGISQDAYDAMIEVIISNEDSCVKGYQDEKIYLNTQCIYPTERGVYLDLNGQDYAILPVMHGDANGCYIQKVMYRDPQSFICPYCRVGDISPSGKCNNSQCKSNTQSRWEPKEKKTDPKKDKPKKK